MAQQTRMNQSYVYGNTAPAYHPEYEQGNAYRRALEERERKLRQEEEQRKRLRARRILEREKKKSRMSVVTMTIATALILGSCALYIQQNSKLSATMKQVATLEAELINITQENDATQKRVETSVNLEDIRKQAMDELGMVYPSENQIVYYHIDNTDYMEQYKDIPTGNESSLFGMIFQR